MFSLVEKVVSKFLGLNIQEQSYHFSLSLVVIGPQSSGKSCFIERSIRDEFISTPRKTVGITEYSLKVPVIVPSKQVLVQPYAFLNIREVNGLEQYTNIWLSATTDMPVIVLVYDCQQSKSYEKTLSIADYIMEQKKEQWRHTMFVLVACKADEDIEPKIPFSRVREEAHKKGWIFFICSARDDPKKELIEKWSKIVTAAIERYDNGKLEIWKPFVEPPEVMYRYINPQ